MVMRNEWVFVLQQSRIQPCPLAFEQIAPQGQQVVRQWVAIKGSKVININDDRGLRHHLPMPHQLMVLHQGPCPSMTYGR